MSFKEAAKKELHVVVYGQSALFRVVKYIVIVIVAFLLYKWKGGRTTAYIFLMLALVSIAAHFFFRWKTKGWTQSWGLYKSSDNKF
jgi:hypothetical protein